MRSGNDAYAKEAEFCAAQSGESAVDEWAGSDCLHSGGRAQFAGALDRARARWTGERFAGRALPHCARNARRIGCGWAEARSFQVRSKATEGWRGSRWRRRSESSAGSSQINNQSLKETIDNVAAA